MKFCVNRALDNFLMRENWLDILSDAGNNWIVKNNKTPVKNLANTSANDNNTIFNFDKIYQAQNSIFYGSDPNSKTSFTLFFFKSN